MDEELNSSFLKTDDRTTTNPDRKRVSIAFENMTNLDETVLNKTISRSKMLWEVWK